MESASNGNGKEPVPGSEIEKKRSPPLAPDGKKAYNDDRTVQRRKALRHEAFRMQSSAAKEQRSFAPLHCNEHRANDSKNLSLPNESFGSEINRILD